MLRKQSALAIKEVRLGWALILPSVVIIFSLIAYPVFSSIVSSFYDVQLVGEDNFAGFENYRNIITDLAFWSSVATTLLYVVFSTLGTIIVGLLVALVMNQPFPLRGFVRGIIILPYVAPVFSIVYAWKFIFDPVNGVFMDLMVGKLGLFSERFNLIGDPQSALWVAVAFSVWKNFPFAYLMILSRLQAIDKNMYEAAKVDGTNWWQRFRFITMPELHFVVGSIILLRVIWNFNKFEDIFLLTENLKVLSIFTYFKAFTGVIDIGQGSALVIVQFCLLVVFILLYVKKVLKW